MATLKLKKEDRNSKGQQKYKGQVSHKRSAKQESSLASRLGGTLVPRSGAGKIKGDVRIKGVARIEAKTTIHKSYSLTLATWLKIKNAAVAADECPAMVIEFLDSEGNPVEELAVVPVHLLAEFTNDDTKKD